MKTAETSLTQSSVQAAIVRNPLIVSPDITVREAIAQMHQIRVTCVSTSEFSPRDPHLEARSSCVLVVEGDRLLGLLTERDIVSSIARQLSLDTLMVREAMTSPVVCLYESALSNLSSVVNLLQQPIRYVPLLDDRDRIVGLLTPESLLLKAFNAELEVQSELKKRQQTDISDRKQIENKQVEKLRFELTLLESILENILAGYWDWDILNNQEYLSPGFKRTFGYEADELPNLPETWQNLIFAEDLPGVLNCFDRHVQSHGKVPYYNEVRYRHKDGSTVWVLCSGQVIEWDSAGQPLRMIGCHIDISEFKATEQALTQYAREVEDLYNNAPCGYHSLDGKGRIININNTELQWLGYTRAELLGESFAAIITDVSLQLFQQQYPEFKRKGWVQEIEFDLVCKDGSVFPVFLSATAVKDAEGNYLYSRSTLFDARDRKQAEQALIRSRDLHEAIFNESTDALFLVDPQSLLILDCNRRAVDLFGAADKAELIGVAGNSFQRYQFTDPEIAAIVAEMQEKGFWSREIEYVTRQGDFFWGNIAAKPIMVAGCTMNFIRVTNISDRKQSEVKLQQTTIQLEASNKELEAFAYSVSHDLRSPLRAIDGFSKALLEDYGDQFGAEGKDYFDRIRHNVGRMGMLIDDLLRLSRVSRSEMQYSIVNLSTLVQEYLHELQTIDPDRQVIVGIAPEAIVFADLTLMRVVISNLLQNAWKFTSHHATARIEFGAVQRDGQSIYFVRDDGAGFDMVYAKMLFGVFQRLHNTHEFPGTGIGLATVQRVIHRHGGQVWAEAAVEQGATVYFTVSHSPIQAGA